MPSSHWSWQRMRRFLKWAGLLICLLLVPVYVASGFRTFYWGWRPWGWNPNAPSGYPATEESRILILENGCLCLYYGPALAEQLGWKVRDSGEHGIDLWPDPADPAVVIGVPLWLLFLLVAAPTGRLWWVDRRRVQPGKCRQCGYDLTGNQSGVCPECGTRVPEHA